MSPQLYKRLYDDESDGCPRMTTNLWVTGLRESHHGSMMRTVTTLTAYALSRQAARSVYVEELTP